jgi:D-alanine-D-alanine ligase
LKWEDSAVITTDTADRRRLRIALIFGGRSGEHEVSVVSARSVARALDDARYDTIPMAIDRAGRWSDADTARAALSTSGDRTDEVATFSGRHRIDPRLLDGSLDVAFPVLHGPYGEDGTIQGLFEMLNLPYVGCDLAASAVCMDKILTKRLLVQAGLPTPEWRELRAADWQADSEDAGRRCLELGLPLFVKPACLGSSVGISKVSASSELCGAIDSALAHDHRVIVERALEAREIEVAVLGNERPRASVPGEVVPGHDFYDYEDKYLDDSCQLLAPAPLDEAASTTTRELAVRAFRSLGCEGMARVDLFLERGSEVPWVNEVNTIPGFTSISMYPRLWALSGLDYPDLLDELVRLALERHGRRKDLGSRVTG